MARTRGAVAAGHALTADAAEQILHDGGNAFDAVIAALAMACVAEPVLASPAGGGFLLARPAGARARVYDFFVHTPRVRAKEEDIDFSEVQADFGPTTQAFHIGRGTIATPGVVRGMFDIQRDLCSRPMSELVYSAVKAANEGVRVTEHSAYVFDIVSAIFKSTEAMRAIFGSTERENELARTGERLLQPELADSLEVLAIEGADLFYRGEMARRIVEDLESAGQLSADDLEDYAVILREPLAFNYRDADVLTNPPPSSGGILAAFGLKLLEHERTLGGEFGSAAHLGLLARTMSVTATARVEAQAASPNAPLEGDVFLDPAWLERYRREIWGNSKALRGTTQISVADEAGNLASLTVSNGEGSGYVIPGTGIVMNNMLGEEDINPQGFQHWTPDRRMTSMMAPTAVLWRDGRAAVTGTGGSNRIRSVILQMLVNLVDFGMPVEDAVNAPRMHWDDGLLSIEGGFDLERIARVLDEFPEHHLWEELNLFFGGAHTVATDGRSFTCAGDPRRGGESRTV
ncbi:MAG: gamma-glutamyltransferase [Pseudomonadales bacterium]